LSLGKSRLRVAVLAGIALIGGAVATSATGRSHGQSLPPSLLLGLDPSDGVHRLELPGIDVAPLLAEDEASRRSGEPFIPRFATAVATAFGPHTAGSWSELADGSELWRFLIHSPGALNLNLHLGRFELPPGAALWLHDPVGGQTHGPYSNQDRNGAGELWTPVVVGDSIVMEILVPPQSRDRVDVEVTAVNHGYRPFGGGFEISAPKLGDCNIDVICPQGDDWRRQIRSVARISIFGTGSCSGVLLNNTAEDDTPYLLTAQHCVGTTSEARSLVTYWNFESPSCGLLSGGSLDDNQSGAELVASWGLRQGSDFSLVVLDALPDPDFGVYYAGWDATGAVPQGAVAIHQPRGDEKAISFDHDPLTRVDFYGYGEHQWRVGQWEVGTTENGSSGSCIFEPSTGLCVGTLTTGTASCSRPDGYDIYGAFDVHWSGNGTSSTRLSDWLDPGTTGQLTLAGKEPAGGGASQRLWLIPAAASSPGAAGSDWRTQILVVNPTHTALTVQLNYTAAGVPWPGVPLLDEPVVVSAGRSLYLDDPLAGSNPTSGMVYAVLDGHGGLVSSRTYNVDSDGSTFGQGIPGLELDGSAPARYALPLVHNAPGVFRTNVGIVQTSPGELTVRITAHAPNGVRLGSEIFSSIGAFRQINNIFAALGIQDVEVEGAWLEVELVGPAPAYWTCYASVIDSRTDDPTYVPPVEP
jgi:hypothetical protein